MKILTDKFHEPQGLLYHGLAVGYAVTGYVCGLAGLFSANWVINTIATLWLAHAMAIAAYLIHECGHNTVFRTNAANARLGRILNWICGACYGTYEDIRYKHFRHHVDNDDTVWFDYDAFFRRHPFVARVVQFFRMVFYSGTRPDDAFHYLFLSVHRADARKSAPAQRGNTVNPRRNFL